MDKVYAAYIYTSMTDRMDRHRESDSLFEYYCTGDTTKQKNVNRKEMTLQINMSSR